MIDTSRQTEEQGTDRLTEKNRPTEIQWDRQTKKHKDRETKRPIEIQRQSSTGDKKIHRETKRRTERQKETEIQRQRQR